MSAADYAAARRQAEEALANWDSTRHDFAAPGYATLRLSDAVDCVLALRALLAASSAPPSPASRWRSRDERR